MGLVNLNNIPSIEYGMHEALRALRTNIKFCGDDIKVIMLTSASPNEGKSVVSVNLARSLTELGKNVLLIDTDMRKSVLLGRLGVVSEDDEEICGLSHYLSGQEPLERVTYQTNIDRLYMVFAGPSVTNPTELLEKKYFEKLILGAREKFDYVVIDTAPVGATIDAAIIAQHCDGTLLVVAQNQESSRHINEAKNQVENAGGKILGVVLNKVNTKKVGYRKYYGKYYRSYYGYGEESKGRKKK